MRQSLYRGKQTLSTLFHFDTNILSRFCYGELSKVDAPYPFFFRPHSHVRLHKVIGAVQVKISQSVALRSLFGTEQVARDDSREAPPF
jgi:hypothetical protein